MVGRKLVAPLVAGMLVAATITTAATATAGEKAPSRQAHYCKRVDAYRLKTCATALLPAGPLGRQLRWELAQLAGEAATLTEAEVRAHFSAEFFAVWREEMSPEAVIQFFQQNLAERGPFTFIGFAYPPRTREALALVQQLGHLPTLLLAEVHTILLSQHCREVEATHARAEAMMAVAATHGFVHRVGHGRLLRGWALAASGHGEEGRAQLQQALLDLGADLDAGRHLVCADRRQRDRQDVSGLSLAWLRQV